MTGLARVDQQRNRCETHLGIWRGQRTMERALLLVFCADAFPDALEI